MDGGGRVLRSLSGGATMAVNAAAFGFAGAPSSPFDRPVELPKPRRAGLFGARGSVSVPWERRLPRHLGSWLALAFFAAVGWTGFSIRGGMDDFREAYGEPRHALGRALGLGI